MSDQEQTQIDAAGSDAGRVLEWTVHPVMRKPWVSVAVSVFVFLVVICVHSWMQSHLFTLLAMLIMLGSLAKFYFPTHYKLTDRNVTVKTTTQTLVKEWKLYRSSYPDKKGILLSPFATPSRLENFRGLYIMFEKNTEPVTAFVRERIARAQQSNAPAVEGEETA